eukprot:230276-Rhodomonas_salina.1
MRSRMICPDATRMILVASGTRYSIRVSRRSHQQHTAHCRVLTARLRLPGVRFEREWSTRGRRTRGSQGARYS